MSNILIFSPTPSHPQNAGNRARIYTLAKALQNSSHKIFFLYFTQEGITKEQEKQMQQEWDKLYIIEKTEIFINPKEHHEADDWYQEGLGEEVQKIVINNKIDTLLCNYIFQSKILEYIPPHITTIIDTHDKFSNRHHMLKKAGIQADFFYTIPSQEAQALSRADKILAIQTNEADFFRSITDKQVHTLGHLQPQDFLPLYQEKNDQLLVGFIGSSNTANTFSLQSFLEDFLSRPAEKTAHIKLAIAGSITNKLKLPNPLPQNIQLLGNVEDLKQFYSSVELIINPLILGTGLKIKTIEALSYAKPILSTAIGFEGINTTSKHHTYTTINELVDAMLDLSSKKDHHLNTLATQSKEIFTNYITPQHKQLQTIFTPKPKTPTLIVTHINFWHRDLGSRNRLYDLIIHLLKTNEIVLLYINPKKPQDQEKIDALALSKNVLFLEDIDQNEQIDLAPLQQFLEKHPVLKTFASEEKYKKLATFLQNYTFKQVIIEYIHLSYFLPLLQGCKTYLDTHDIMYKRYETFKQNNEKHWIEITKEEEFALFKEYSYALSIQKNEHSYLLKNNIKSLLVPYSFKISNQKKQKAKKAIIFIGGDTLANFNAIDWFLKNVWDLFIPCEYSLEIYGDISKKIKTNRKKKIYAKGRIQNLDTLYNYTDLIAINPVHIGGGLKIKNVEALCSAIPLLTTTQGAYGIEDGIDEAFLVANTPDQFKDKLLALIISKKLRDKLASNALSYAKQNFHSDVCYTDLSNLLQSTKENYV